MANLDVLHLQTHFLFPISIDQLVVMEEHPVIWGVRDPSTKSSISGLRGMSFRSMVWQQPGLAAGETDAGLRKFQLAHVPGEDVFHPFIRRAFFDTGDADPDYEALVHRYAIQMEPGSRLFYEAEDFGGEFANEEEFS